MRLFDAVVGDVDGGEGLSHQLQQADRQMLDLLRDLRLKIRACESSGKSVDEDNEVNEALDLFFIALCEREHIAVLLDGPWSYLK